MTEAKWRDCVEASEMLAYLRGRASERKFRLFAVGCCRRIWELLKDPRSRAAVELAERFADGGAPAEELAKAHLAAHEVTGDPFGEVRKASAEHAAALAADNDETGPWYRWCAGNAAVALARARRTPHALRGASGQHTGEMAAQCRLLRDLFDDLFRPVKVEANWLARNDGAARHLAQMAYDDRDFSQLPILADALEDAGCDNAELLAHLRGPGEHARGCWALDALLGKK